VIVSPTSIRSRILKVDANRNEGAVRALGFTHVDPFEDTERYYDYLVLSEELQRFTHVDPFEDTESHWL